MPYKDPEKAKESAKRRHAKWAAAHPEYFVNFREKNREKIKAYRREYYARNREKLSRQSSECQKRRRQLHPEIVRSKERQWHNQWRANNPEKNRAQRYRDNRNKRARDKEKVNGWKRSWYSRNKERIQHSNRAKRMANAAHYRVIDRRRYERTQAARILQQRNTQAKRRGAEGIITPQEWLACLIAHDFRCFYCHIVLTERTRSLDHKTPLCRGGKNTIDNVVPACRSCNSRKSSKTVIEYILQFLQ